jgi:preprotein translocase subunit YajC
MTAVPNGIAFAAQQASPVGGPDLGFFLMMGSIFAIFYFLVARPQQKQKRELEQAVKSAAKGDQVVTSGGLHGRIVATDDDLFTVEIATLKGGQSVRVQVSRAKVDSVTSRSSGASDGQKNTSSDSSDKSDKSDKDKDKDKDKKGGGA